MSHPHELLLQKNNIVVTDLPEKTQKKIAKFAIETDDDKREALDESIYGEVEDHIEAIDKKKKEDAKKASHAEAKKAAAEAKKIDVSNAPTAAGAKKKEEAPATPKERSVMDVVYGRK